MTMMPRQRSGRGGVGRPASNPRRGVFSGPRWRWSRPHASERPRPVVEVPLRPLALEAILSEFTARWERGEAPRAEDYLDRIAPADHADLVELIYHEYCLADSSGRQPDPADYLRRFPDQRDRLRRVFGLHDVLDSSELRRWAEPTMPESGDAIGPYHLVRELGRGSFA